MTSRNKITLIFIVNGVDVSIDANIHEPLKVARNKALTDSNNTGRPMDEWEIHNDAGQALDPDKKIEDLGLEDLGLVDGARLFLNLKVGAGGVE